jgi:hypothetical protein
MAVQSFWVRDQDIIHTFEGEKKEFPLEVKID